MDFLNVLAEALKSERDTSQAEKAIVDVPQLEKTKRIENVKDGREVRFKKVTDDQLFLDPSDGFFFRYNAKDNFYLESNASFSFIIGANPKRSKGISRYGKPAHAHDLKQITHEKYGYGVLNFRVDKRTKKVHMEKIWGGERGTKVVPNTITDPEVVKDALKVAAREHSELNKYTFVPTKSTVEEYIKTAGAAALESGGTLKAYFVTRGTQMKKYLQEGLKKGELDRPNTSWMLNLYLEKKEASKESKNLPVDVQSLYNAWAIGEVVIRDQDQLGEQHDEGYEVGKDIPAKDIKLFKTNLEKFFDKDFTEPEIIRDFDDTAIVRNRYDSVRFQNIFIARDQTEWDYFKAIRMHQHVTRKRGRRKGLETIKEYGDKAVYLLLPGNKGVNMFKPGNTKEDIKKFLAEKWINDKDIMYRITWEKREELNKMNFGYDIYFNHKYPELIMHAMMIDAFKSKGEYEIEKLKSLMPPFKIKD